MKIARFALVRPLTRTEGLQFAGPLAAKPEGDKSQNAERTVNQPPPERNAAQAAKHQRVGNHQHAGEQAKIKQPTVAKGVAQSTHESQRDNEMPERQPVGAVEKKRILFLSLGQSTLNAQQPLSRGRPKKIHQQIYFTG